MEIICDTNIWYNLGSGLIDSSVIKTGDKLVTTFNSIDEFARTGNLLNCPDNTRKAIQCMFNYSSKHAIYEPPFIYWKIRNDSTFQYDILSNHKPILEFTELIAKGHSIEDSKKDEFRKLVNDRHDKLQKVADFFNEHAQIIKPNIKDLKKHRRENSIPLNRELINLFVANQTKTDGLSVDFDWSQVSLFENTLKVFFNEVETGAMTIVPNDWYDLFLLIYVNPGKKVWTREKKWKMLITKAGMEEYLYEK